MRSSIYLANTIIHAGFARGLCFTPRTLMRLTHKLDTLIANTEPGASEKWFTSEQFEITTQSLLSKFTTCPNIKMVKYLSDAQGISNMYADHVTRAEQILDDTGIHAVYGHSVLPKQKKRRRR